MPPKSSASSGTRKKHARRAAQAEGTVDPPPPLREKKGKKHRSDPPRPKVYVPPVKPTAAIPDPLETTGLAHRLPPELLVILRSLGKKASVTKVRALEELQSGWIERCGEDETVLYSVLDMLPVWLHHLPAHLVHPQRRIRLITASIHAALLHVPLLRGPLIDDASDMAAGTWALAAHDVDRTVAAVASADPATPALFSFLERTLMHPDALYTELNPPPPPAPPPPSAGKRPIGVVQQQQPPRIKADELEESEPDRRARLRIAAFGALKHRLETTQTPLPAFLASPALWSSLHHTPIPPFLHPIEDEPVDQDEPGDEPDEYADYRYGAEYTEGFGVGQPALRRTAWGTLAAIIARRPLPSAVVSVLSCAVLRSAWVEPDGSVQGAMWGGLLGFLRHFPSAWTCAAGAYEEFLTAFLSRACGGSPVTAYPSIVVVLSTVPTEIVNSGDSLFAAFWAALGGPPAIASFSPLPTPPADATSARIEDVPLTETEVVPAPALTTALPVARARAGAAYVSALLECAVFLVRRRRSGQSSRHEAAGEQDGSDTAAESGNAVLTREIKRVWAVLVGGGSVFPAPYKGDKKDAGNQQPLLHIGAERAASLFRSALENAAGVGDDVCDAGLDALGACVRAGGDAGLVCAVLASLVGEDDAGQVKDKPDAESKVTETNADEKSVNTKPAADVDSKSLTAHRGHAANVRIRFAGRALLGDVLRAAVRAENDAFLVRALGTFGARLFSDEEFAVALDEFVALRAYKLLLTAPQLLFAYLTHRALRREALYRALLVSIAEHPEAAVDALRILVGPEARPALAGLSATDVASELPPSGALPAGPLDALFADTLTVPVPVLAQVLQHGELFLSSKAWSAALSRVVGTFTARVEVALKSGGPDGRMPLQAFSADLELLGGVLAGRPDAVVGADAQTLLPAMYAFAYVLPRAYPPEELEADAPVAARNIWLQWRDEGIREPVFAEVKRQLGVMVCSTGVCVTPEDILVTLAEGTLGVPLDVIADVFPAETELDAMLDALPAGLPSESLAVLHPHLSPASADRSLRVTSYDERGYSAYARIVAALLQALVNDRRAAKENIWALRHVLALTLYAEDLLAVPAVASPLFDTTSHASVTAAVAVLVTRAQQLATYLLTASVDDSWQSRALTAVTNDKPLVGGDALPSLLVHLIGRARSTDGSRDCRVLDKVLRHVLQDADKAEADLWIAFGRKVEKTAPETCMTIISAVSNSTLEPPRLERYRNELAADLFGIPSSKANTQGLLTLRKLAASAPSVDSDVVFLSQQRSVNIFKACQQWITSDEDIEEALESAMTHVFFYLAPLLQNVPGTHWDLIFDVVDSNLENATLTDDDTLVTLARTLRLIILIQDLILTNKMLRASWEERQMQILTMVRDLAAEQLDNTVSSLPRSTCRELVLSIIQDLPPSLITEDTLAKMCHLLADPSIDVQKMAYQLLTVAARKHTEHLVIEAGVDVDEAVKAELPIELLDILQLNLNFDHGGMLDLEESPVFGYLLGWMVVFDLFIDASLKVRLGYSDQLRAIEIIGTSFIPNVLTLLGIDQGIPKAFKLDVWTVDEYYVQLYECGSAWSLQVLAAHLYYRALLTVPSLIHTWVLDCKDRTLLASIGTYTAQHFSPVLIRAELTHVRSAGLGDESLTVKVAVAVNEVAATYLVDDHRLEIRLKIPADWPLRKIEVKDVQHVGVEEMRWRAWLLAVQQTLWAQNGRIVDGLGLFKKNMTLHFEGQVECAICYSIISVTDGALPRKPCKTCKNRFHSACLYKWFSTSHSSSCPLCRSDII
ncbi:hypothetical protein GGX14DRAFT_468328 [Mycena pura]|uniref:E3 ubiquitin-protein ligase listerin n=1 Tax=Mycena pura TaxID=153505 RepID=A0AAD6Y6H8_9AGAR|nr:hypothetical protein GGX14DRAFT_468328 [Mycena pura]